MGIIVNCKAVLPIVEYFIAHFLEKAQRNWIEPFIFSSHRCF